MGIARMTAGPSDGVIHVRFGHPMPSSGGAYVHTLGTTENALWGWACRNLRTGAPAEHVGGVGHIACRLAQHQGAEGVDHYRHFFGALGPH